MTTIVDAEFSIPMSALQWFGVTHNDRETDMAVVLGSYDRETASVKYAAVEAMFAEGIQTLDPTEADEVALYSGEIVALTDDHVICAFVRF